MVYTVHIEPASSCCCAPREILLTWGCVKLVFDILMLAWHVFLLGLWSLIYLFYPSKSEATQVIIYAIFLTLWIIDLALNSMLVHGIRKKSTELLKKYRIYSYVLWVLIPILGFVYAIICLNNLLGFVYNWETKLKINMLANICSMAIALVFQTFVLLPLGNEVERLETMNDTSSDLENVVNDKAKGLYVEFTTKIDTSMTENVADDDVPEERIETSCEKAQLID